MTVEEQALLLPRADKLRLMEALWSDLSRDEAKFESPSWHESAVQEAEARYADGRDEAVDWDEAKRQLREQ